MRRPKILAWAALALLGGAGLASPYWAGPLVAGAEDRPRRPANAELMFLTRGSLEGNIGVVG